MQKIRTKKELGEIIRSERKKQNLKQAELAKIASVRQPSISDIETGEVSVKIDTLFKVVAALDLDFAIANREKDDFDPTQY